MNRTADVRLVNGVELFMAPLVGSQFIEWSKLVDVEMDPLPVVISLDELKTHFMRHLVNQDRQGCQQTTSSATQETSSNGESVREIIDRIRSQVQRDAGMNKAGTIPAHPTAADANIAKTHGLKTQGSQVLSSPAS
ncbi:unnamed protein product [Notodromas monacha]|uniref:Uncharacterized protein n=1 Tax=Notodromas monacha TaxID=399045 RepID=A0A7R9BFQ6_9CRUS|nr:unnamed protein product [Notodromas monacha]CAG0914593.1 unnamed protein product [Notodromas monacha]